MASHIVDAITGRALASKGHGGGRSASENFLEVLSYAVSFGAFYAFIWVSRRLVAAPAFQRTGALSRLMHACVSEDEAAYAKPGGEASSDDNAPPTETFARSAARLGVCAVGIQISYLLWGLMQERIMTQPYETGELFRSSKFLVFANRFLALLAAWGALRLQGAAGGASGSSGLAGAAGGTPLYTFSFSSVSNILSSVCQYEALKFVSFPTQVLSKSCKMVPVMLMGYVVNKRTYSTFDYGVAIGVTGGAALFKLYEVNDAPVKNTEFVGIVLIVGYMVFDSFTSNWQSKVFKQYGVSSTAMMFYANLFSSGFTFFGLLVTLECVQVYSYLAANPSIVPHIMIMAVCSAIGQLFIFYTIKQYGPLVFATIQTVRQFLSVVLSIVFFGHPINGMEAVGIGIVFLALGAQVHDKWMAQKRRRDEVREAKSTPPQSSHEEGKDSGAEDMATEARGLLASKR